MEPPLAQTILDRVDTILTSAGRQKRPIEMDPFRGQLFEVFVTAEGAGLLDPDAESDLRAEALCQKLGDRWGLAEATRASVEEQQQLPPEHLAKMRMLWSTLRLWMEWDYAWKRWPEFHDQSVS